MLLSYKPLPYCPLNSLARGLLRLAYLHLDRAIDNADVDSEALLRALLEHADALQHGHVVPRQALPYDVLGRMPRHWVRAWLHKG